MPTYVALLRGVNVGKAKRVPMADLRDVLAGLGYTDVATLLNSGNAAFRSKARSASGCAAAIARALAARFGFDVPVVVKSTPELIAIVAGNPLRFTEADHSRLLVAFVQDAGQLASLRGLDSLVFPPEQFKVGSHGAYLLCASGLLESKAGAALLGKAGRGATTRNWATVLQLLALAHSRVRNSPRRKACRRLMAPRFFAKATDFRRWLERNSATTGELVVGFHKVGSGQPSVNWPDSVDEALCYGWIDGVRKRIDEQSYLIRFTPRKAGSIWSAVNVAKAERLIAQGRMQPAGLAAYQRRTAARTSIYSYEQLEEAQLTNEEQRRFRRDKVAWNYFQSSPAAYRRTMLHRVVAAKRPETRARRLERLIAACAEGTRL